MAKHLKMISVQPLNHLQHFDTVGGIVDILWEQEVIYMKYYPALGDRKEEERVYTFRAAQVALIFSFPPQRGADMVHVTGID